MSIIVVARLLHFGDSRCPEASNPYSLRLRNDGRTMRKSKVPNRESRLLGGISYERYIRGHHRETVSGAIHWAQRSDDSGRFSGHRVAAGRWNNCKSVGRLAAGIHWLYPFGFCLAYPLYRSVSLGAADRHSIYFHWRLSF